MIEYIPLMNMNGDQRFIFGAFNHPKFLRCLLYEQIEELFEGLVRFNHNPTIVLRVL